MKKSQMAFILFGEGIETNVKELNKLLEEGWTISQMCPMPSSTATGAQYETRFYEPQCVIILEYDEIEE